MRQLEQLARRGCGCCIPGSVQGQVEWDFEQLVLVEGIPAYGRSIETRGSLRSLPTQTFLVVCASMPVGEHGISGPVNGSLSDSILGVNMLGRWR